MHILEGTETSRVAGGGLLGLNLNLLDLVGVSAHVGFDRDGGRRGGRHDRGGHGRDCGHRSRRGRGCR